MQAALAPAAEEFDEFLARQSERSLLRFITCGSVDDGKSTLIGRLLYESKLLFEDQVTTLEAESKQLGTQGGNLDFALLVDGLAAEREQGITIDVAFRFFATDKRKFIVADTPGHEQYTRNMATGASTADLAIVLIDARKGVLQQTRRHSLIVSLLGVRHVVLAVNKMDLVGYSELTFAKIEREYRAFAGPLGFKAITCIPLAALKGDNVVAGSAAMSWYSGPTLIAHLETVEVDQIAEKRPFRMPVQWVNRSNSDFRGFSGLIASGRIWPGDRVRVLPSGQESRVSRIVTADGDHDMGLVGQSITLVLADEIDVSRGDMLVSTAEPASVSAAFEASILWMSEDALKPGRPYILKLASKIATATLDQPSYLLDINDHGRLNAETLGLNEIGLCRVRLDQAIAFDAYNISRETGGFILIDRESNDTVAMGFIQRRLENEMGEAVAPASDSRAPSRLSLVLCKTISRHGLGALAIMALVYALTGDLVVTFAIGAADIAIKSALHVAGMPRWTRIGSRRGAKPHEERAERQAPAPAP